MTDADTPTAEWRLWAGPAGVVTGVACLVASFLMPSTALRTQSWTERDAIRHQQASENLHRLSMSGGADRASQEALQTAQQEFAKAEADLAAAKGGPLRLRGMLRWGGALLAVVAAVFALATKPA